ncbi:hypothetical protein GWN42_12360, partial [candidate division KSB1 bacterium]|nr:hypothetical protein [candidate division KSB1 bacterium]
MTTPARRGELGDLEMIAILELINERGQITKGERKMLEKNLGKENVAIVFGEKKPVLKKRKRG